MCDPPVSRAVAADAIDTDAGEAERTADDVVSDAAAAAAAAGVEPCVPLTPAELHSRGCGLVRLLEESGGGSAAVAAAQRWVDAEDALRARTLCELRVLAWAAPGAHRMDKLDVRPGAAAGHPGYPEEHCFFLVFVERLAGDAAYGRTILLHDVCARVSRFCAAVRLFCSLLAAAHDASCGILSDCTASKRRAARLAAEKATKDEKKKEEVVQEEEAAPNENVKAEGCKQPLCPGPHPLLYPVEQPLLVSSVYRVLDGVLHPQHLLVTDRRLVLRPTLSLEDLSAHGGGCGDLEHLPLVNCNEAAVEIPATLISGIRLFQEKRDVAAAAATRVYARHRRQQQQQALLQRKKKTSVRSSPLSPRSSAPNLQDGSSSSGDEEEEEEVAPQAPHSLLLDEELLTASKRSEYLEVTCKNTWQIVLCFREPRDGYAAFSRLRKRPKGEEDGGGGGGGGAAATRKPTRPVVAPRRPAPVVASSAVLQRPPSLLSDASSENPLLAASGSPAAEAEAAAEAQTKAKAAEPATEYYLPRRLHPSPAVPGRFSVARTTASVLNAFLPKAYAQDSFFALAYARKLFFPLLRAAEVAAEAERFHVEELQR
eukprot:Rhum_TRINITY_DN14705_c9_g1::Rhum_TRINITY_DN14705_c9_g1_i1::g.112239::m.112239